MSIFDRISSRYANARTESEMLRIVRVALEDLQSLYGGVESVKDYFHQARSHLESGDHHSVFTYIGIIDGVMHLSKIREGNV